MKNLNVSLRQARLQRMWTLEKAAREVNVSFQTFIRWESGTQSPHLSTLTLLCETFDMTAEELGFGDLVQVSSSC